MNYLVILLVLAITSFILKFIFGANLKKLKAFGENKKLDDIAKKHPNNIEMCKKYLKMLKNENVKIEEDDRAEASIYYVVGDTIKIGTIGESYTRIQTIAHECLHSIQEKKLLILNFIISNIFILYFLIIVFCRFFNVEFVANNQDVFFGILVGLGIIYAAIRIYLENDAMIKAKYLAKEYMQEQKISTKEEIEEMVEEYEKLNNLGIKCVNYNIYLIPIMIIALFSLVCAVR